MPSKIPGKSEAVIEGVLVGIEVVGDGKIVKDADFRSCATSFAPVPADAEARIDAGVRKFVGGSVRIKNGFLEPFVGHLALDEQSAEYTQTHKYAGVDVKNAHSLESGVFDRSEQDGYPWADGERLDDFISDHGSHADLEHISAVVSVKIQPDVAAIPQARFKIGRIVAFALGRSGLQEKKAKCKGQGVHNLLNTHSKEVDVKRICSGVGKGIKEDCFAVFFKKTQEFIEGLPPCRRGVLR